VLGRSRSLGLNRPVAARARTAHRSPTQRRRAGSSHPAAARPSRGRSSATLRPCAPSVALPGSPAQHSARPKNHRAPPASAPRRAILRAAPARANQNADPRILRAAPARANHPRRSRQRHARPAARRTPPRSARLCRHPSRFPPVVPLCARGQGRCASLRAAHTAAARALRRAREAPAKEESSWPTNALSATSPSIRNVNRWWSSASLGRPKAPPASCGSAPRGACKSGCGVRRKPDHPPPPTTRAHARGAQTRAQPVTTETGTTVTARSQAVTKLTALIPTPWTEYGHRPSGKVGHKPEGNPRTAISC
jgi:hypothetical protein